MSKVLSWEDRQTRGLEFVQQYVENGGNATEATVEIPQPVFLCLLAFVSGENLPVVPIQ